MQTGAETNDVTLAIRFPESLAKKLEKAAQEKYTSRSAILRQLVGEHL